jgi:hypothetical protein
VATHFLFTSFFLSCITYNALFAYKNLVAQYFEENSQFYEEKSPSIVELTGDSRINLLPNSAGLKKKYDEKLYY